MSYGFDFSSVLPFWPDLLSGLYLTVVMTVFATVFGLVAGIAVATARRSRVKSVSLPAGIYVETLRNTPFIVQLFFLYFGLASIGIHLSAVVISIIAMVLNVGAYTGEIIRAGLDSIPAGQLEAAECLGLSSTKIFFYVSLIPAIENVYPALTSQFVLMMLMTSVTSQISTEELSGAAYNIQSTTFRAMEVYITIAVIYVLIAFALKLLFVGLGRLLFRRKRALRNLSRVRLAGTQAVAG
ncbi:amino acid ABC transporter permease [Acidisphaera sp. L21]|uniref:amino acid ABC transporter permease n=1 Tax=Acidisphaera sp. L21 TaxID=1641851 RepID=UPI00131B6C6F|nr:amino acid ABC transporter permease [Acidisphaera sp. L21]